MKWQPTLLALLICLTSLSTISTVQATVNVPANKYIFTFPSYSGTAIAFSSDQTFSQVYRIYNTTFPEYWFFEGYGFQIQGANMLITTFFIDNELRFQVTTSTSKIYTNDKGEPSSVVGATSWNYDAPSKILTISVTSSSPTTVIVTWTGGDTTAPTYSDWAHNTTITGEPCEFSIKWQDNVNLSYYIFSWNSTGSWANDTGVSFTANPDWANVTKTLPSAGSTVGYMWYACDTSSNWASTPIFTLTTTSAGGSIVVLLNTPSDNSSIRTKAETFTFEPVFFEAIQNASLWLNLTDIWQVACWNTSEVLNSTLNIISFDFNVSATYIWNIAVANSTAYVFSEANRTLTVLLEPNCDSLTYSTNIENLPCQFSSHWLDGDGLSGFIFSWFPGTTWENDSWTDSWEGEPTSDWAYATKTLPEENITVYFRFFLNDTDDNWVASSIQSLTTISQEVAIPPPTWSPPWGIINFLGEGDLFGFIQALFVMVFHNADIFWGIIVMLFAGALYIRTRSLALVSIVWLLVGTALIAAMPLVAGLGLFLIIVGIAGLLFELFTSRNR